MNTNENQAVIDLCKQLGTPDTIELATEDSAPRPVAVAVPTGKTLKSLKRFQDMYRAHPEHREGTAQLETVGAFCDYVNRFKGAASIVFAAESSREGGPELVAIIDHHAPGAPGEEASIAGRCMHTARYAFPLSDEWRAWMAVDGRTQTQEHFAEFVEDRLLDVIDPARATDTAKTLAQDLAIAFATPAQLRDLGSGLKVRVNMDAGQAHNVQTGESSLLFKEKHSDTDGKPLVVPGGFVLGVPVFQDSDKLYQLIARLRYRVKDRVSWVVKLHRPDQIFRHAFGEACEAVAAATELPVLRGLPEVMPDLDDDE